MSGESRTTKPVTFRILRSQADSIEALPKGTTGSALVRVLLKLYFDGRIPLAEAYLTSETQDESQNAA